MASTTHYIGGNAKIVVREPPELIDQQIHCITLRAFYANRDDVEGKTDVAVKMFSLNGSDEDVVLIRNRLVREAGIWSRLDHPNILPLLGTCEFADDAHGRTAWLITQYCSNGNIMQYLTKNPQADRILLLKGVGNALLYLHEEGIIHGDLRPGIIAIRDNGEAAIYDFGRSKRVGRKGSTTYTRGTCRYSAPEAWSERSTSDLTEASDVYSFGMIALHIISGITPFLAEPTDAAIQRRVIAGDLPTRQEHPKVTTAQWRIIEQCWDYKAENRLGMSEVLLLL